IQSAASLTTMDPVAAAAYRGRYVWHGDHDDNPCPGKGNGGCCNGSAGGAPIYFISDYLNLWVVDMPLHYKAAYGPDVALELTYTDRREQSSITQLYWHGAQLGNLAAGTPDGLWGCSWLSFAELDSSENVVELMLPASGWATFTFSSGLVSDV